MEKKHSSDMHSAHLSCFTHFTTDTKSDTKGLLYPNTIEVLRFVTLMTRKSQKPLLFLNYFLLVQKQNLNYCIFYFPLHTSSLYFYFAFPVALSSQIHSLESVCREFVLQVESFACRIFWKLQKSP